MQCLGVTDYILQAEIVVSCFPFEVVLVVLIVHVIIFCVELFLRITPLYVMFVGLI